MINTLKITPREKEVLRLLANDYTSRELAAHLHISMETVKSHRRNLSHKFGVKTTGGLIKKGFEYGVLNISL